MELKHINISETLSGYLSQIKDDSIIANTLLHRIPSDKLVNNHVDYISLSNEDPFKISYLTPERIEKIDERGENLWQSTSRYHTKYGSFVNKIFNCFDNKEVEKFSNLLRSVVDKKQFKISVVSGTEIAKWYNHEQYADECAGTLAQSCMKHDSCNGFFEIYSKNPDTISMLIFTNEDDLLIGRALLWQYETYKIMDRIYTINDENWSYYFKQWANTNGFSYKEKQGWNWTTQFESNGKRLNQKLAFKLKNISDIERFPYLDTFKWFNYQTGDIFNHKPENTDNIRLLIYPDGSYNRNPEALVLDSYTGSYEHADMVKLLPYRSTDSSEFRTSENNLVWSDLNDTFILKDDSIRSKEFNDYIFNEKYSQFNENDRINARLEQIKKRAQIIIEEIALVENKVMSDDEIIKILDESYANTYDRADIKSIIDHYHKQRQRQIDRDSNGSNTRIAVSCFDSSYNSYNSYNYDDHSVETEQPIFTYEAGGEYESSPTDSEEMQGEELDLI